MYFVVIDGVTAGAVAVRGVLAQQTRLRAPFAGEASGKIDIACVVSVVYSGTGKTCVAIASAAKVSAKLEGLMPRFGRLGEFSTTTNFSGEAEPF